MAENMFKPAEAKRPFIVLDMRENVVTVHYKLVLLASFVLSIGNRMFWVCFLHLSEENYCPQDVIDMTGAIMGFCPGIVAVRKVIRWLCCWVRM
jgi:hypothetical protein